MKLHYILLTIFLCVGSVSADARSKKGRTAHEKAHKTQLANVKSRIDRTVISDMLKEDVSRREASAEMENAFTGEQAALVADLLKEANSHMGKRYRSGAKGPNAFDCSGFSSYVFRQFGYKLSPSSREQYTQGTAVDRKQLRAGDLVFFSGRRAGKTVGHVGIVVSADNEKGTFRFIHAARTGIKIDNCDGYYAPRYIGARRVI